MALFQTMWPAAWNAPQPLGDWNEFADAFGPRGSASTALPVTEECNISMFLWVLF